MNFWSTLASKEVDIYIGIATTILGLILGELLNYFKRQAAPAAPAAAKNSTVQVKVQVPITISTITNIYKKASTGQANNDDATLKVLVAIGLFSIGVVYLNFRGTILNGITSALLLILPLFFGALLTAYVRGFTSGGKWLAYLLYLIAFYVAAVMVRDKALIPNFAPNHFLDSEAIIRAHGISGMKRVTTLADLNWYMMHVAGVVLLVYSVARLALSGLHLSAMTWHFTFNSWNSNPPWLAIKTARYRHVYKSMLGTAVALLAAYFLVSGNAYMWWVYEWPALINNFMNSVFYGAAG